MSWPERWSFGGGAPIKLVDGTLSPRLLIAEPGLATLEASFDPIKPASRQVRREVDSRRGYPLPVPALADLSIIDDEGKHYGFSASVVSGKIDRSGTADGPMTLHLTLDSVPNPAISWLELRGRRPSTTRLVPPAPPEARVSPVNPVPGDALERELTDLALSIIRPCLLDPDIHQELVHRDVAIARARAAALQQSATRELDEELTDQLARLGASLIGRSPSGGVPASWAGMLDAAWLTDGPARHLAVGAALPEIDGVELHIDFLVSESSMWFVYLRAVPGWWLYDEGHTRRKSHLSLHARDNLGGEYACFFDRSTSRPDCEVVTVRFRPRLDPGATELELQVQGVSEQVVAQVNLVPLLTPSE